MHTSDFWLRVPAIVSVRTTGMMLSPDTTADESLPGQWVIDRETISWIDCLLRRHRQALVARYAPINQHPERSRSSESSRLNFKLHLIAHQQGIHCTAASDDKDLLSRFVINNLQGDQIPPWIVFPGSEPSLSWGQGTKERWLHEAWWPFWRNLSESDRRRYIEQWCPVGEWREELWNNPRLKQDHESRSERA